MPFQEHGGERNLASAGHNVGKSENVLRAFACFKLDRVFVKNRIYDGDAVLRHLRTGNAGVAQGADLPAAGSDHKSLQLAIAPCCVRFKVSSGHQTMIGAVRPFCEQRRQRLDVACVALEQHFHHRRGHAQIAVDLEYLVYIRAMVKQVGENSAKEQLSQIKKRSVAVVGARSEIGFLRQAPASGTPSVQPVDAQFQRADRRLH